MLKTPTKCDNCNSIKIMLWEVRPKSLSYVKRKAWPFVYKCLSCSAECGLKLHSIEPMGKMAMGETRFWRTKAHHALDKLWQGKRGMPRFMAYRHLAAHMNIPVDKCHIANFDVEQCKQVIEFSTGLLTKTTKRRRK